MPPTRETGDEVHVVYERQGFDSAAGHRVRSNMEAAVCDWLMAHDIAHRHGSEIFPLNFAPNLVATMYVPDIVLHDRLADGRRVVIEVVDSYVTKEGGTRLVSTFRTQMGDEFYVIIIVKRGYVRKVLKRAYDLLIEFETLGQLETRLARLMQ